VALVAAEEKEWLEADGRGGFASGTASLVRTRRYHALLLTATQPPTGRMVLVNGFDAFVETENGRFALTSQRYESGVVYPDGTARTARRVDVRRGLDADLGQALQAEEPGQAAAGSSATAQPPGRASRTISATTPAGSGMLISGVGA